MKNIFIFSTSFKKLGYFLKFNLFKIGRWFSILIKKRKELERISFGYYKNWHYDNAYLVIDFKFKNAIWFKIGTYKCLRFDKPVILNIANIKSDIINFEVFGFFQKQTIAIQINKEFLLESSSFKTQFSNLNNFKFCPKDFNLYPQKLSVKIPKLGINAAKPILKVERVFVKTNKIKINFNTFKIQDYI